MNIEKVKNQSTTPPPIDDLEFDFRPITSGLGFHHPKTTEVKPVFTERTTSLNSLPQAQPIQKKEANVYQNDLSLFYGQAQENTPPLPQLEESKELYYPLATKTQRFFAYITDLLFLCSVLGIVMTIMARTIRMDLMEVWSQYPNEITPLVCVLFCGFYIMYFSIFEKANQSTLGKSLFNLRVTDKSFKTLSLSSLLFRTSISLLNFSSLGLFSYFDLQNKVVGSKVIRIK